MQISQLHWLPVRQRIDYKLAVLTYKIRSTSTLSYLSRHIRLRESARHLRLSAVPLPHKPTTRTRFADRAFRCTAPTVWNSLAIDVTSSCLLTVFKSRLKTHIFRQTFNLID